MKLSQSRLAFEPDVALVFFIPILQNISLNPLKSVAFGDVEMGFAQSDYVREDRFETQITGHCALEPHAALAWFDLSGKLRRSL